jgi:hypothetical protein
MSLTVLLFPFIIACSPQFESEKADDKLPTEVRAILNKNFKGWKFSTIIEDIYRFYESDTLKGFPNFVWGDFDGNGEKDYAIKITMTDTSGSRDVVVAFLKTKSKYSYFVLTSHPSNPEVYLYLLKKGEDGYDVANEKPFVYENDSIGVFYFEKAGGSYVFKDNKFIAVITSD